MNIYQQLQLFRIDMRTSFIGKIMAINVVLLISLSVFPLACGGTDDEILEISEVSNINFMINLIDPKNLQNQQN